MTIITDVHDNL